MDLIENDEEKVNKKHYGDFSFFLRFRLGSEIDTDYNACFK